MNLNLNLLVQVYHVMNSHLNLLVHDMINLLYYEYWTDKQKYLYVGLFTYLEPLTNPTNKVLCMCKFSLSYCCKFNALMIHSKWFNGPALIQYPVTTWVYASVWRGKMGIDIWNAYKD